MFSTAGRSVKSGLVAAAVVSSWTWAATLLQSSAVAYQYGVSGPFFYASGTHGTIYGTLGEEAVTDYDRRRCADHPIRNPCDRA